MKRFMGGLTMSKDGTVDLGAVLADPAAAFAQPQDVLTDARFSPEIKLKILRQWERDAHNLAVADNEGMSGGEESMHGRVLHAIRSLEESAGQDQTQTQGKSDRSASRPDNSYTGLTNALETVACQLLNNTRRQPLAALLIAAGIGYLWGRVRRRF
jgi:hypothetical protein